MTVADLLAKADRRLIASARDLEAGDIERSLSASYYAMFYAASAALEGVAVSRAKHSAVIAAFGEQFARTQRTDPRFHAMLLGAFALRSAADYETNLALSRETAEETLDNARAFVTASRALLPSSEAG